MTVSSTSDFLWALLFMVLMFVAYPLLVSKNGFDRGYSQCLTDSCQASCLESGYDDAVFENDECVCIQFSVME